MAKDTFHEDFIRELQGRYAGILRSHVPAAAPLNGQEVPGVPPMQAQAEGPGVRFTGNGPDNLLQEEEPAGVVHEGEQVVEADMVQNAGGPEKVRDTLEDLVQLEKKKPGFQTGTGSGVVGDVEELNRPQATPTQVSSVPSEGFGLPQAIQTDPVSVPVEGLNKPVASATEVGLIKPTMPQFGDNEDSLSTPFKPGIRPVEGQSTPTATPTVGGGVGFDVPEIPPLTEEPEETDVGRAQRIGLGGLEDIAAGESKAAELERRQAESELKGRARAEQIATGQQLAASGASEEAARAEFAGQSIEQRAAAVDLQSRLAMSAAERAEAATAKLAEIGTDGVFTEKQLSLDEQRVANEAELTDIKWDELAGNQEMDDFAKTKWGDTLKLDWAKYGLDEKQINSIVETNAGELDLMWNKFKNDQSEFGMDYALRERATNWTINKSLMDTAMGVNDYDSASAIAKAHGFDIDFSDEISERNQGTIGDSMANVMTSLEITPGASINPDDANYNADIHQNLQRAADAQGLEGGQADKWMQNTLDGARATRDPVYSQVRSFIPSTIETMLAGGNDNFNINSFSYAGATGVEAGYRALTTIFAGGGMTVDDNGNLDYDWENPAWQVMGLHQTSDSDRADEIITRDLGPGVFETVGNISLAQKDEAIANWDTYNSSGQATWDQAKTGASMGTLDSYTTSNVPGGANIPKFLEDNPSGYLNMGGTVYKVVDDKENQWQSGTTVPLTTALGTADKPKYRGYVHLQTEDGVNMWVDNDGNTWAVDPGTVAKNISDWDSDHKRRVLDAHTIDVSKLSEGDREILARYQMRQERGTVEANMSFADYLDRVKSADVEGQSTPTAIVG